MEAFHLLELLACAFLLVLLLGFLKLFGVAHLAQELGALFEVFQCDGVAL